VEKPDLTQSTNLCLSVDVDRTRCQKDAACWLICFFSCWKNATSARLNCDNVLLVFTSTPTKQLLSQLLFTRGRYC